MKKVFVFCFLFFLAAAPAVLADSTRARVSNVSHLAQIIADVETDGAPAVAGTRFSAYINGVGRVQFTYDSIRVSPVIPVTLSSGYSRADTSPVILMQGWAAVGNQLSRAAGMLSIERGKQTLTVDFMHTSNVTGDNTLYRLVTSNLDSSPTTSIERTKDVHFKDASCGNDTPLLQAVGSGSSSSERQSNELSANAGSKEIELSIHMDSAYISKFGSSSSYLQGILNAAEVIYSDDLDLTFSVKRILADSGLFFFSGEGDNVLVTFADYIDNSLGVTSSADVFHVFTGVDLTGGGNSGVIGVAFIGVSGDTDPGVVCRPDRFNGNPYNFGIRPAAVGATERSAASTAGSLMVTFAHEVGHNFSAEHTSSGIMTASLDFNNLPGSFSSASKNTIGGYVDEHGSCLSEENNDGGGGDSDDDDDNSDGGGGGGGGGGVGGAPPDAVAVDFNHTLSQDGLFVGTVSIEEAPGDDCLFRIYLNTKKNVGRGTLVASTEATDQSHTFIVEIDKKARKRNKKGKRIKVWATGVYQCISTTSGQSAPEVVKAHKISTKRKVGAKRWIKLVRKALLVD